MTYKKERKNYFKKLKAEGYEWIIAQKISKKLGKEYIYNTLSDLFPDAVCWGYEVPDRLPCYVLSVHNGSHHDSNHKYYCTSKPICNNSVWVKTLQQWEDIRNGHLEYDARAYSYSRDVY
jgi:hypothetical protein